MCVYTRMHEVCVSMSVCTCVCVCVCGGVAGQVKTHLDRRVPCANKLEKNRLLMMAPLWEFDGGRTHVKPLRSSATLFNFIYCSVCRGVSVTPMQLSCSPVFLPNERRKHTEARGERELRGPGG